MTRGRNVVVPRRVPGRRTVLQSPKACRDECVPEMEDRERVSCRTVKARKWKKGRLEGTGTHEMGTVILELWIG